VQDTDWPRNLIDHWVLHQLEAHDLQPSAEADRATLIRRLYLDLIGLPPTPEEVAQFEADLRPTAYDDVVERLLASPHFGERLAIFWLDLVRFADTVGYHGDQEHAISPYRDYVIAAFNDNMPFDQFTREQLAGDLLPNPTLDQKIATGYNRMLQTTHEGGAQDKEYLAKYAADRVRNLSAVWMGATVGCAECHDHKFDPYTQRDFYSLAAFFADVTEQGAYSSADTSPTIRPPEIKILPVALREEGDRLDGELTELKDQVAALEKQDATSVELPPLREKLAQLKTEHDQIWSQARLTMITVPRSPRTMRVLSRGDWMDETGEVVEPAVPAFMPQIEGDRRATRLDLARWLTRNDHPQTPRVFVNRLWTMYFGDGLSPSLEDFGAQGEAPHHPELLDALAAEFVEGGWNVKGIIRTMVTSAAYRQSSLETAADRQRDPFNRRLARQGRFRIPAELIRDHALAVSGLLVLEVGGASVRPYQPDGYYSHLNFPKRSYVSDADSRQWRRGVYMHWQRQFLHPALLAFDAATREECTAKRPISNTPKQSLVLLNDPTFVEAARNFAARILRERTSTADRLDRAFLLAVARRPSDREGEVLTNLLNEHLEEYRADEEATKQLLSVGSSPLPSQGDLAELAAWTSLCRAILNLNETITRN